jgi:branched-chain amino acid transport system permease protein
MFRQNLLVLFLILFSILLAACTPGSPATSITPTPPPGTYDGEWEAQALTSDGKQIHLTFVVRDSVISWLSYSYPGQAGQTCTALLSTESRPTIINGKFIVTVSSHTASIDGTFNSSSSASGHISFIEVESARALNCVANINATWSGTKKPEAALIPAASTGNSWCGKNVNCSDLLIQLLIFGLVNGAILALNAIGVTVIYSTVRTINLAHGDVFALTTVLVTSTINLIGLNQDWPEVTRWIILLGVLLAGILLGMLLSVGVEELAFRPFRGRSRLGPIIASLGLSFILYQGSLIWRTFQQSFIRGEHRSVPGLAEVPTDGIPNFLGAGNLLSGKIVLSFGDIFVFTVAILFVIVATYILLHTKLGLSIRSVAQNPELAEVVGVNQADVIRRAFALGGALAGAAAFVFALYYSRPFGQAGAESGLIAFAAALLGGIGSPGGAMVSGLLLGVTGSISDYFISAQWTPVLVLGLLTALLIWRRGGLLDSGDADETKVRDSVVLTSTGENPHAWRWLILSFIGLGLLPAVFNKYNLDGEVLLRGAGIFILLALGLNILLGLSGVLDLGYAMSYAVGAYTAAILTNRFGPIDFTQVVLISGCTGALFGALKGGLAARLQNDYLAIGTLALGLIAQQIIVNLDITGGPNGFSSLPPPHFFGFSLGSQTSEYYLVFMFVLFGIFLSLRLTSSRTGRAWLALSDDNTAAISAGIDTSRYRMLAFVLSSVVAAVGGALYASTFSYIDPNIAAFDVSAMILAMVILGGAGSATGIILGTLLIYGYDRVIIPQLSALIATLMPQNLYIGMVPNIRGTNFFNFGIALYLTVLWRARKGKSNIS